MYNRINEIKKITKNKNFNICISEIFDSHIIDFIEDFSRELKKIKRINSTIEINYLRNWTSKKNILDSYKNYNSNNEFRVGRGLIFHVCPNNVPTNFVFSFFLGLLSGNSNIVKLPSSDFAEKKILMNVIKKLFNKKKFKKIKDSNYFVEFLNTDSDIQRSLSLFCDGRVIWGGDETIKRYRDFDIPSRSIEINFADRYSTCLINYNKFKNQNKKLNDILSKKFFFDSFVMNQMACNSPHVIMWVGKNQSNAIKESFWKNLSEVAKKNYSFDSKMNIDKLSKFYSILDEHHQDIKKVENYGNHIKLIKLKNKILDIEPFRGFAGIFFEIKIDNLSQISNYLNKKCQTIINEGFKNSEIQSIILQNNILGIDRVVSFGKALEFEFNWDGYDVIRNLSRTINFKN